MLKSGVAVETGWSLTIWSFDGAFPMALQQCDVDHFDWLKLALMSTLIYSTRRSRTGSTMNPKALIASTAARIVGSETGSTVMTNETRSLGRCGSCSRESMLTLWRAMTSATRATIPRWSFTVRRKYQLTGRGFLQISM